MEQNNIKDLVAVDLHVHTPYSKCYNLKGHEDIDDEYIDLLELYVKKEIKVIAITDHNSIGGYRHLMKIKEDAQIKIKILEEVKHIDEVKKIIERENYKLQLFNEICILPGVEFEANPGIHLLLLFNPEEFNGDNNIEKLEVFLQENGYPKEIQGCENPEVSKKSAIDIIESAKALGAITIAAHVESNKGALENLPKGQARAQFFKSSALMAIQVVSLSKIDYIKELYKNSEYKREHLPAFVRCSDYHNNGEEIEKCVTYMRISELTFEALKDGLINNTECISFTKNPHNEDIIKNIIDQNQTYTIENLNDESCELIKKYICCILNSGSGNIVLGVRPNKSIVGIKKKKEDFQLFLDNALEPYEEFKGFFRYNIQYYDYGNHLIGVISMRSIKKKIYDLNQKVYLRKNNEVLEATPNDLVKIGEENFRNSLKEINNRNKYMISRINKELNRIKLLENNINLYTKVKDVSLKLKDISNISLVKPKRETMGKIEVELPGNNFGNIYIGYYHKEEGPHNNEFYTRVTCPRNNIKSELASEEEFKGECIIILAKGITHYIEGKEPYRIAATIPVLRITLKEEFENIYSLKGILAWLKSPSLLSFLDLVYGKIDLYHPKIVGNIPIIMNEITKINGKIEKYVDKIISKENSFLQDFNMLENTIEQDNLINEHNKSVATIAREIEKSIKMVLGIEEEEDYIIKEFIKEKLWQKIFIM